MKRIQLTRRINPLFILIIVILLISQACNLFSATKESDIVCPPVAEENEQVVYDDSTGIGLLMPSYWVIQTKQPGFMITQSFISLDEAKVNGMKCDLSVFNNNEAEFFVNWDEENSDVENGIIVKNVTRENIDLCGLKDAKYKHIEYEYADLFGSNVVEVFATIDQESKVHFFCWGDDLSTTNKIVHSLFLDIEKKGSY